MFAFNWKFSLILCVWSSMSEEEWGKTNPPTNVEWRSSPSPVLILKSRPWCHVQHFVPNERPEWVISKTKVSLGLYSTFLSTSHIENILESTTSIFPPLPDIALLFGSDFSFSPINYPPPLFPPLSSLSISS